VDLAAETDVRVRRTLAEGRARFDPATLL
jgi:hypothetical protein